MQLLLQHCAGRCCGCLQALLALFLSQLQQLCQVLQVQAHNHMIQNTTSTIMCTADTVVSAVIQEITVFKIRS
jgi:hypothetical protein